MSIEFTRPSLRQLFRRKAGKWKLSKDGAIAVFEWEQLKSPFSGEDPGWQVIIEGELLDEEKVIRQIADQIGAHVGR
ncbi:MAG: hypothetical protein ACYDCC_08460 [Actinomycetota bacterium]